MIHQRCRFCSLILTYRAVRFPSGGFICNDCLDGLKDAHARWARGDDAFEILQKLFFKVK